MKIKNKLQVVYDAISLRQYRILDNVARLEELKNEIKTMYDNGLLDIQEYKRLNKLAKHVGIALYGRSVEVQSIIKDINKWVSIKKKKQRS